MMAPKMTLANCSMETEARLFSCGATKYIQKLTPKLQHRFPQKQTLRLKRTNSVGKAPIVLVMKISIIIPVYNEVETLPEILAKVQNTSMPDGCTSEIIVVDDCSVDGTLAVLDKCSSRIQVHRNERNCGKGSAIRTALAVATGDIVLVQDGDLEYDPKDYRSILTPIVGGRADVVYGSRFLGVCDGMKWQNWLANKTLTATANLLYQAKLTDQGTAYKAFRTDILRSLDLKSERFEFCSEVTAKVRKLGHTIHEVPITYKARTVGEGKKIRPKDGFHAIWILLKFRFSSSSLISIARRVSRSKAVPQES
jgi:dolichol-phosphate mannosyltransferase